MMMENKYESSFLTRSQEDIIKSYGYVLTHKGVYLEIWKISQDSNMIDIWKDEVAEKYYGRMWISENQTLCFSPKRIKSFLKKRADSLIS